MIVASARVSNLKKIHDGISTIIYKAIDEKQKKKVVLKVLKNQYSVQEKIEEFKNEYYILSKLKNIEGIIQVYDLIDYQNTLSIIMEDFNGQSLETFIDGNNLDIKFALVITIKISEALEQVHRKFIIHKNIKPGNILINHATKMVRIIDFSLASDFENEIQKIIRPEFLQGTFAYMSPEQTGRMNRPIGYQTDIYSLGITLYRLFTGKLPFEFKDPVELVYSHIARHPPDPREINGNIPEVISKIILKLMEKSPEKRYMSVYGLIWDLRKCLIQLKRKKRVDHFRIATQDVPERFQIPEKLYGRTKEVEYINNLFRKISNGENQILMITGQPGIGKSVLINEIRKPLFIIRGSYICSKCEPLKKNTPYFPIIQAFDNMINDVLTENEENLNMWKEAILNSLGTNGQVIVDIIPKIEFIIGKQPVLQKLSPEETQNRFNMTFRNFLNVFSTKKNPLVFFIDDLQWADCDSLNLLNILLAGRDLTHFLFLGAYRDNEIDGHRPLSLLREKYKEQGIHYNEIKLKALEEKHINALLADTLYSDLTKTKALSQLIYIKTGGNPFFVKEILKELYHKNLIRFNNGWRWDLQKIKQAKITDNVVELMTTKMKKLHQDTLNSLKIACCLGIEFKPDVIAMINKNTDKNTLYGLKEAINGGMLIKIGNSLKFVHDKVREAVYSMIENNEKKKLHYNIGKMILLNKGKDNDQIFDITGQLNSAVELLSGEEKYQLLNMNFKAGKIAKESTAYDAAVHFFKSAADLLPSNSWEMDYSLILAIYTEWSEAAYLAAQFDSAELLFNTVLTKAVDISDKVPIYMFEIDYFTSRMRMSDALKIGIQALSELNMPLQENSDQPTLIGRIEEVNRLLGNRNIPDLINLPELSNQTIIMALKILMKLIASAYISNPSFYIHIVIKMVELSIIHGNNSISAYGYNSYGLLLAGAFDDIEAGFQFGKLSIDLANRFDDKLMKGMINHTFAFYYHFKESLAGSIPFFDQAHKNLFESANLVFYGYSILFHVHSQLFSGTNLKTILTGTLNKYLPVLIKQKHEQNAIYVNLWKQTILNLSGISGEPMLLNGDAFIEKRDIRLFEKANDMTGLAMYFIAKQWLAFFMENYNDALLYSQKCKEYLNSLLGAAAVPVYHFFHGLSISSLYHDGDNNIEEEKLFTLEKVLEYFEYLSRHCETNYRHKYYLINAEISRIKGNSFETTAHLYEKAIEGAKRNNFLHEEAMANELAGRYFISKNFKKIGGLCIQQAFSCYMIWGCGLKTELLNSNFPGVFNTFPTSPYTPQQTTRPPDPENLSAMQLDINAIMKASQTISGEIILDKLLVKLLRIAIKNAGARKGVLLLEKEKQWYIEAMSRETENVIEVLQGLPIRETKNDFLPAGIINFIINTKESVLLDNAEKEIQFKNDPYIIKYKPKSILCIPLINQKELIGILYLENKQNTHVFTPERIEILSHISVQAAISIRNALLYEMAITDGMTKLFIKRYFTQRIGKEFDRAGRFNSDLSIALFDLDHFKNINDTYGHQAGDFILIEVAKIILNNSRNIDIPCRYGGEELIVILPETGVEGAMIFSKKIRQEIQDKVFLWDGNRIKITISGGVANTKKNFPSSIKEFIGMADKALYYSKENGRNRVTLYESGNDKKE